MKRLCVIVGLVFFFGILSSPVMGEWRGFCAFIENEARIVMDIRQRGVSLKNVLAAAEKTNNPIIVEMIFSAYNVNLVSNEYKGIIINEFANGWYKDCVISFME